MPDMHEARKVHGVLDEELVLGGTARLSVHLNTNPEQEWRDTGEDVVVTGLSCDGCTFPESLPKGTRVWARTQPPSDLFLPVSWGEGSRQNDVGPVGEQPHNEPKRAEMRQAAAKPPVHKPVTRAEAKASKAAKAKAPAGRRR